jgi:dUTP pyrophosphatase
MANTCTIQLFKLPHAPEALPAYATAGSAGMDIRAAIAEPLVLAPLQRALVPTGLIMAIPEGFEVQLRARSGLAIKHGITLINGIGTIDSDYRDEVKVALVNLGAEAFTINPAERICQLVVAPVTQCQWQVLNQPPNPTEGRGGGFGSTGVH